MRFSTRLLGWLLAITLLLDALLALFSGQTARATSSNVVITQVYGGGGNSGANYQNDFIELFNLGGVPVSLNNWSVQYAQANSDFGQTTILPNFTLNPGQYFLIQEGTGNSGGLTPLPNPNVVGGIGLSATQGKVALLNNNTLLNCGGPITCTSSQLAAIIDLVGYGTTSGTLPNEGGSSAPATNNNTAVRRIASCIDTDRNNADFTSISPSPRNSSTTVAACSGAPIPSPSPSPTATPNPTYTPIYTVQGAARRSPFENQTVTSEGVVTGLKSNGFFMQDSTGDGNPATSDGIFVYTRTAPTVSVGNRYRVNGTVQEFVSPTNTDDAPFTEIINPTIQNLGTGGAITPIIVSLDPARNGPNLRRPPAVIFNAATPGYNPASNGFDFYESLESMLVQVDTPKVVGATSAFGDFVVVPDNGIGASGLNSRGGINISPADFNPERIVIDNALAATPQVIVGDRLTVSVTGPLDYAFGNFRLQTRNALDATSVDTSQRATQESIATLTNPDQLRIVSYNVENFNRLGANAPRLQVIANHIRQNLAAPDILVLCEIQDDSGPTSDATVSADLNLNALRDAIIAGNGPTYSYRYVNPQDGQDGGQPGGNIRQVFFFRTDRGLTFVDKPGGNSTTANTIQADGSLLYSPGRIDPTNAAFSSSRKPLAGEFSFKGQRLILIGNHLNSKQGDNPLYGGVQPPVLASEIKRRDQASIIRQFVTTILTNNPAAYIVVAGDLNDFEFSRPLNILKSNEGTLSGNQILTDAVDSPEVAGERYTYNYEGNSQVIDHVLYSQPLAARLIKVDIVHLNADFNNSYSQRATDHEPVTATFDFNIANCLPFYVNNTNDSGCGSLRNALTQATSSQTINIQPNLAQIRPASALPPLPDSANLAANCTLDTATGRGQPDLKLNGADIIGTPTVGLKVGSNSIVSGLAITNFSDYALEISGSNNQLNCNWLGTADGQTKQANAGGVRFKNAAANNSFGQSGDLKTGNLISGNAGYALLDNATSTSANQFYYNLMGYTLSGALPLRNGKGIKISGSHFKFVTGNHIGL